jgi:tetratricopeptide (TPR) repeat protein
MASDPNALLRAAEQHYADGAPARARPLLEAVLRIVPDHPQLLQFHAILLRALGDLEGAARSIEAAHRIAPHDPRIGDTRGNILGDLGRHAEALAAYDGALAADPDFGAARLHRAVTLQELGRIGEARVDYTALGDDVTALLALAGLEIEEGAPDAARAALDRALALQPGNLAAGQARARVAFDRGERDAGERLVALLAAHPDHPDLLVQGLEELGSPHIVAAVERRAEADSGWSEGRRALALHRRQREGRADWLGLHEAALAERPRDGGLWRELIDLHSTAHEFAAAATAARRAAQATGDADFLASAFAFHDAAGEEEAAEQLLARLDVAPRIAPLARAKHLLRMGDPAGAEALLGSLCDAGQPAIEPWALRGVAWQLLDDPRWRWLNWQEGMVAPLALDIDSAGRAALVERLRALHADAMLYIGHSVRDGTQTRGNLFQRSDPILQAARDAILDAVAAYRAGLPPADPAHPLLRHRDHDWRITASWSIRLTEGGFHISHIHPKGIVSSASYWVVPDGMAAGKAGWLELGRPPAYLGIDLDPIMTIEPVPGQLVLFPSTLHHGTRAFSGDGERITAAFDLAPVRG